MPRGVPEKQAHPRWALRNTKGFKEKRKNEEALQRYPDAGFQPAGRVWRARLPEILWIFWRWPDRVGPARWPEYGDYQLLAFAGNPYFIDLDQLAADGLLKPEDYAKENWGTNPPQTMPCTKKRYLPRHTPHFCSSAGAGVRYPLQR